jgi:hypothetical protein
MMKTQPPDMPLLIVTVPPPPVDGVGPGPLPPHACVYYHINTIIMEGTSISETLTRKAE